MAGIIAQITRANRERIEKRKFEVGVSKCMYELKPFDPCFKAEVRKYVIMSDILKQSNHTKMINGKTKLECLNFEKRPFSSFQKDNKYIRATLGQKEAEAFKRVVVKRLYELKEENKKKIHFSWG